MTAMPHEIRLLLVDDEVDFLEAMTPGLVRRGFRVSVAEDGYAALRLLSAETVDVVVLDVKMPGIDGVETFRQIKRVAPTVPVILLTGHASIPQAFETSRDGVANYLAKPCDAEALAGAVRQAMAGATVTAAPAAPPPDGIRLLLVDDDADFTAALVPALSRRGALVSAVDGGAAALAQVRERRFDVAIVDVRMPDMDGVTLLKQLREIDPRIEVILLTGHPTIDDVRRGLQDGAFDYLPKPQRVEDLWCRVRAAEERRREREEESRRAEAERILSRQPD